MTKQPLIFIYFTALFFFRWTKKKKPKGLVEILIKLSSLLEAESKSMESFIRWHFFHNGQLPEYCVILPFQVSTFSFQ